MIDKGISLQNLLVYCVLDCVLRQLLQQGNACLDSGAISEFSLMRGVTKCISSGDRTHETDQL